MLRHGMTQPRHPMAMTGVTPHWWYVTRSHLRGTYLGSGVSPVPCLAGTAFGTELRRSQSRLKSKLRGEKQREWFLSSVARSQGTIKDVRAVKRGVCGKKKS